MNPKPDCGEESYRCRARRVGKMTIITCGDGGVRRGDRL